MVQKSTYKESENISKKKQDLEVVFNSVTNSVIILGPDQTIISVNSATEQLTGVPKSELINKKCYEVLHGYDSDSQPDFCPFNEIFSGKFSETIETEVKLKSGDFLVTCTPIFDKSGNLERIIHVSTNITEIKKQEKETAMLLEATRSIPLSKDFNQSARKIYDICKEYIGATCGYVALMSKNKTENDLLFLDDGGFPCFVDPSLPMPIRGLRKEAYDKNIVVYSNMFMKSKYKKFMPKGHMVLDNVLFAPLVFGDTATGVIGLANKPGGFNEQDADIAKSFGEIAALALKHSNIQDTLIERDKFSNSLLEQSPNPILVINPDRKLKYANPAFENLSGFSFGEVSGVQPVDQRAIMTPT